MRVKVTSKGQVTIPVVLRKEMGMNPNTEVEFRRVGDRVELRKVAGTSTPSKALVERLRGRVTSKLSTDEIMALTRDDPCYP